MSVDALNTQAGILCRASILKWLNLSRFILDLEDWNSTALDSTVSLVEYHSTTIEAKSM